MNAKLAPSAAPPNALKIWCDAQYIYVQLPGPSPVPCIISQPRTGVGLGKILSLIYGHAEVAGAQISGPAKPKQPLVGTKTQHTMAEAILRRNRIIR